MTKLGCVVQGDLRVPIAPILRELRKHCDVLILSTWEDQQDRIPANGDFTAILNQKPAEKGITNRNCQRLSTAAGLALAETEGCTHVLKWRTDMLPTRLSREDLLRWAGERPVPGLPGRIVMSAFRNLSADPDWFSSFPDLFAFGELSAMKLLWSNEGFDYARDHNVPPRMEAECHWRPDSPGMVRRGASGPEKIAEVYDAHVELYAHFKERLQVMMGRPLSHAEIVRDALRLIDHRRLGICWLKSTGRIPYRSIFQCADIPWWTEAAWQQGRPPRLHVPIAHSSKLKAVWLRLLNRSTIYYEKALQMKWHLAYQAKNAKR